MNIKKSRFISHAAVIAALYVVLTYLSNLFGLASGVIQIRLSEALAILAFFTPAAIPGLFVGCFTANLLISFSSGIVLLDLIGGSLTTLIAAALAYLLRRKTVWLAPLPNVLLNSIVVPFIIAYGYGSTDSIPFMMLTVGIGEIISCYVIGMALLFWIKRNKKYLKLY